MAYEKEILNEIMAAIANEDQPLMDDFGSFGNSLRSITINVHAYLKGLKFGYTEISLDKYGWLARPE